VGGLKEMDIIDSNGNIPEQSLDYLQRLQQCEGTVVIAKRKWVVLDVDRRAKTLTFRDSAGLADDFELKYQKVIPDPTKEPRSIVRSMLENPDQREFILSKLKKLQKDATDAAEVKAVILAVEQMEEKCRAEGKPLPSSYNFTVQTVEES